MQGVRALLRPAARAPHLQLGLSAPPYSASICVSSSRGFSAAASSVCLSSTLGRAHTPKLLPLSFAPRALKTALSCTLELSSGTLKGGNSSLPLQEGRGSGGLPAGSSPVNKDTSCRLGDRGLLSGISRPSLRSFRPYPRCEPRYHPVVLVPSREFLSTRATAMAAAETGKAQALVFKEHGAPEKVVQLEEVDVPPVGEGEVEVHILAAPLNPSDFNYIEGTYGIKPKLPAIAGFEGVGVVHKVGPGVESLVVGDWVIPGASEFGTWRTALVKKESELLKVRRDAPVLAAATVAVNPCTALRMLEDFVDLKPGDVVAQNGANSGVGLGVIQLAKIKGVKTINVIRKRPNLEELTTRLIELGADLVITDEQLENREAEKIIADAGLAAPKLALNCVGGIPGRNLSKLLAYGGVFVTYGGMAKEPVTLSVGDLIFKDIKAVGYWMTQWVKNHTKAEREKMIDEILVLARDGKYIVDAEKRPITDYLAAIEQSRLPIGAKKQVLEFEALIGA